MCNDSCSFSDTQLVQTGKVLCWIKPDADLFSWGSESGDVFFPGVIYSNDRVVSVLLLALQRGKLSKQDLHPARRWGCCFVFFPPAFMLILFFSSYHSCDSDERRHSRLQSAPCCHAGCSRGYSHSCYCGLQKHCALLGNESCQRWG